MRGWTEHVRGRREVRDVLSTMFRSRERRVEREIESGRERAWRRLTYNVYFGRLEELEGESEEERRRQMRRRLEMFAMEWRKGSVGQFFRRWRTRVVEEVRARRIMRRIALFIFRFLLNC